MTPADLQTAIQTLGMSAQGFARAIGAGSRTVQHWLGGTRPIPGPVIVLTHMLLQNAAARDWLLKQHAARKP